MSNYEKPIISVDAGMAEGVYAASGSSGGVLVGEPSVVADWGGSGQVKFNIDLNNLDPSQLTVVLTFNMDIANVWGGGANCNVSGKQATLSWYSAPSSAEIFVQVSANVDQLKCTGSTSSNN